MKKLILLIIPLILLSCRTKDTKTQNIDIKDNIELCAPACDHILALGCKEAQPLIYPGSSCTSNAECFDGKCVNGKCTETCEMMCEAFVKQGRQLGLECWQKITECEEIESVCR